MVEFVGGGFTPFTTSFDDDVVCPPSDFVVIGNVYENSDLLEEHKA